MALSVTAMGPASRGHSTSSSFFWMGPSNKRIPSTLSTDSWNPAERTVKGLNTSSTRAARDNSVSGSYSRPAHSASIISPTMSPARHTEGVNPTSAANSATAGMPTRAVRYRRFPVSRRISSHSTPTWSPDTAMMCRIPLTVRAVLVP